MLDDAVRAVAELAASQHRAFTRRQAAELNFGRDRVATAKRLGWLDEPWPGVLVLTGSPATWHQRMMATTLADGGHAVASHRAAARLHRLDGFEACDLIMVRRALTGLRRRGDVSLRWVQLTAERLHRPGQRGTGVLLRQLAAIPYEGRVPDSWFEELLALCLTDPDLGPVVPQFPIRDSAGRIVARTDIGLTSVKLGLEAHSRKFHFGPDARREVRHQRAHNAALVSQFLEGQYR